MPSVSFPSGKTVELPQGFYPEELALPGNTITYGDHLLLAYCSESRTGLAWKSEPTPHWQMIQPVSREGFEEWAQRVYHDQALGLALQVADAAARLKKLAEGDS